MADEKDSHEHKMTCKSDSAFDRILHYTTGKIATFVAFMFFLIAAGAIYAVIVTRAPLDTISSVLILAPAITGLLAYSNRDAALIIFFLFLVFFFFLFP